MPADMGGGGAVVELDEEIDGEEIGSRNFRFSKIGGSVPILQSSGANSQFDPQSLPSQPLAVAERFGLLFLAHPHGQGFYVARTKDVMASAEAINDKKEAPSLQELSLVHVAIGNVSILAVAADDSLLAATVSSHVHFFAISALLYKEQVPSYSVSLDDSICIKDLRWARKDAKAYVVLSTSGKLYHGSGQSPPTCLMEGVDSVDWSTGGNHIAVALNNVVSILSCRFKEKVRFLLSFQSVIGDADVSQAIRVDSIRWIRPDSIAVGCFQLNDDGEKENYTVQVITSRGRRLTDASLKPIILSFNNIFIDFCSDAVPNPIGPHLFLSYLKLHGLAFVANRNMSQKVVLFCWPEDNGKNEAATVEILDDAWNLYIDSQADGEENVILGLSLDKASQNKNLSFTLGDVEREVSPCCVIICITIDGKISVFHFVSAVDALSSTGGCASSEEDDASQESVKHKLPLVSSADGEESREITSTTFQSHELSGTEVKKSIAANSLSPSTELDIRTQEQRTVENVGSQKLKVDDPKKVLPIALYEHSDTENQSTSEVVPNKGFFSGSIVNDVSSQSASNCTSFGSNVEPLNKIQPSTDTPSTWQLPRSDANVDASEIPDKVDNSDKSTLQSATSILKNSTDLEEKSSVTFTSFGQTLLSAQGTRNILPAYPSSQLSPGSLFSSGKGFQSEYKKEASAPVSSPLLMPSGFGSGNASQSEPKKELNATLSPSLQLQSSFASGKVIQPESKEPTAPSSLPLLMQGNFASGKVFQSEPNKELNATLSPSLLSQTSFASGKMVASESKEPTAPSSTPLLMQSSFSSGKVFQSEPNKELNATLSPSLLSQSSFGSGKVVPSESREPTAPSSPSMPILRSFYSGRVLQSESKKQPNASPSPTSASRFVQNASKHFGNVEEMAKKLDNLLEGIEGKGGFMDASINSQAKHVTELEEGIWALSDKCGMWRGLLNEKLGETQILLEKTVEVLARKLYMEGLFKQTTDRKYWEFWNRKKLSSELELKQRRISELNQELTNKLIELERHFNSLEFNKFRENEGTQRDRRALQNRQGRSRQIQSLHSVHNTITAQLSAAEYLSGCLSKQMASLCIESSGKHDVKKQLFESIGLTYVGDSERSPARNRTPTVPANRELSIASCSIDAKEQSRRNQSGYPKGSEPQTARRHRDSLDRSWVSFDPPKSTVKRVLKEDYEKGSPNRPLLNINKQYLSPQKKSEVSHSELSNTPGAFLKHHKSKDIASSPEQFTGSPSSLLRATPGFQERIQGSSTKDPSAWLPPSISETRMSQNRELGAFGLEGDKTRSSPPSTGTKFSFVTSQSKFPQQPATSFRLLTSMPEQSLVSPFGSTGNIDHLKETAKDQKNTNLVSETSDTKFPATFSSAFSSAPNKPEKSLFSKSSERPSSPTDGPSASSPLQTVLDPSSPLSNSYPAPLSVAKPSSSTLFPATLFRSEAKEDVSQPQTSVSSAVTLPSTVPSLIDGSGSASVPSSNIFKSEPSLSMFGSKTEVQTKVNTIPSNTEISATPQASTVLPSNSNSGSQNDMGDKSDNSFATPAIKAEVPSATLAVSAVAQSSEGINGSMQSAILNFSHEEEMEEEAPETDQTTNITFANLGGFGIGATQNSTTPKANPFGVTALNTGSTPATSPFTMTPAPSGELFRPASFSFQPAQTLQPTTVNFSGGFGSGVSGQGSAAAGFGQLANVGAGQQGLGSVLGSFGQSRQLGTGLPGSNAGGGFGGGFAAAASGGGFGGGFAAAASGGGFGSLATGSGGGFAAAATGGGFAAAATGAGGFAAAAGSANAGGGFMSTGSGGGFGAFSNQAGSGGFGGSGSGSGGFGGSSSGTGRPPLELFTQMRK
ncbi:nuclear pore complex protein NUP214 isoform X2 [Salvia hispanica]|uniref:nuclear pore complex protein NUP214 isoform X2 n=1 Tax=Salvia hispanica TaxID=49212 RepID=UPI002008F652|nr:nuclear pore complex protein NUP214 isoform X2 [Salvia hispanica]